LGERDLIKTPLCFLDETGTLGRETDPFFAVGLVKAGNAAGLTRVVRAWRDKHHLYEEVKFSRLNKGLLPLYLNLLDRYWQVDGSSFSCFILEKAPGWEARFGTVDRAYELLARQLLHGCCGWNDVLTVIADEYSVGPDVRFEEEVAKWVNGRLGRLAVTQVIRVDSKGVDGVQIADLLVGAVAYDCKLRAGAIEASSRHKLAFVEMLRERVGVESLAIPFRNDRFNIAFHGREPFRKERSGHGRA
jgi:coenzyme F420-reducing hydrogenase delta subunit